MYTPTITSKSFDNQTQQIVLVVEFSNGTTTITETLRYGANFTFDAIKRNLKLKASLLEQGDANEASVTTGIIDVASIPDDTRTLAEIAADNWLRNFERLQKVQILIDLGVLTGNEAPVTTLRNNVSSNFKPAYINLF